MKKLLLLCLAIISVQCAPRATTYTDAPRAIPVRPVINSLDTRIKGTSTKAEDLQKKAQAVSDHGTTAGSQESKDLVKETQDIRNDLQQAQTEITTIGERADALTVERDHFAGVADVLGKKNMAQAQIIAVADDKRRFWMHWALGASGLILLWILFKLSQVYGYSINPLSYLRR